VLITRIVTGTIFVVVVVASVLWLPALWSGLVLGALWLLGVREWAAGFAGLPPLPTAAYLMVFAGLMLLLSSRSAAPGLVGVSLAIALLWWILATLGLMLYPRKISASVTMVAGFATLLPAWALLSFLHSSEPRGRAMVLAILIIVWSADIGAYLVGRQFGRNKLASRISPGKTWEGVVGGAGLAAVAGWFAADMIGLPRSVAVALAIVTALASVVGDLTVSMFKRNAGLKDSGHLLPGHGGVLDRIDSLTAAVAVFVLGLTLVGMNS